MLGHLQRWSRAHRKLATASIVVGVLGFALLAVILGIRHDRERRDRAPGNPSAARFEVGALVLVDRLADQRPERERTTTLALDTGRRVATRFAPWPEIWPPPNPQYCRGLRTVDLGGVSLEVPAMVVPSYLDRRSRR